MKRLQTKKLTLSHTTVRVLEQVRGGDGLVGFTFTVGCAHDADSVKAACCSMLRSGCGGAL